MGYIKLLAGLTNLAVRRCSYKRRKLLSLLSYWQKNSVISKNMKDLIVPLTESQLLTERIIKNYVANDYIPWGEITETLKNHPNFDADNNSLHSAILNVCLRLNLPNIGLSYYYYIDKAGEKLKLKENTLVLKILASSSWEAEEHKDLVFKLFKLFKPHIEFQQVIQTDSVKVFSRYPSFWKELTVICKRCKLFEGINYLVSAAFDFDNPEEAWELLKIQPNNFDTKVILSYFKYCEKKAKAEKFSPKMIDDFINFCVENSVVIPTKEVTSELEALVTVLNDTSDRTSVWSVEKSQINDKICSQCGKSLNKIEINSEDFDLLKTYIFKNGFINKNVNIKTTDVELIQYFNFLSTCPKYDLVVDGLNLLYMFKERALDCLVDHTQKTGRKILIIGKRYLHKYRGIKEAMKHCLVFFTDDRSDDDLFVLYAAFYGGMGTHIVSRDFFRGHNKYFPTPELKKKFFRWKLSHLCAPTGKNFEISAPDGYLIFPQINTDPAKSNKEFSWHLTAQKCNKSQAHQVDYDYCLCLKAHYR